MNLKDLNKLAKATKNEFMKNIKKSKKLIIDEFNDNHEVVKILKNKFKGKQLTEEEFQKVISQLFKDNPKLLIIGGISLLPGSIIALPLAIKIADKLGINLVPNKTF